MFKNGSTMAVYEFFGLNVHPASFTWSWLLSRPGSITFHVGICALYCITVEVVKTWVKSQSTADKPYKPSAFLLRIMNWHNVALSLLSLVMGIVFVLHLHEEGRFSSWHSMACVNTTNTGAYGMWNMVYLLSKLWEWADTYFLILQGMSRDEGRFRQVFLSRDVHFVLRYGH